MHCEESQLAGLSCVQANRADALSAATRQGGGGRYGQVWVHSGESYGWGACSPMLDASLICWEGRSSKVVANSPIADYNAVAVGHVASRAIGV